MAVCALAQCVVCGRHLSWFTYLDIIFYTTDVCAVWPVELTVKELIQVCTWMSVDTTYARYGLKEMGMEELIYGYRPVDECTVRCQGPMNAQ